MKEKSRAFEQERPYAPGAGGLSPQEMREFLASEDSIWLMKLACLDDKGWPYIVPIWYQWNGEAFYAVGRKYNLWVKYLKADPHCAICVEELAVPPMGGNRKVTAQCLAEVIDGPCVAEGSKWLPVANEMAVRYLGPNGVELLAPSHGWERYLVKMTPIDGGLKTWQGADWHARYFEPGQRPDLEQNRRAPG